MSSTTSPVPVVMAISGSDPTGGAGIQADIETISSLGCHTAPVITSVTVQNTINVLEASPVDEDLIIEQARIILEDMSIAAIKIGLVGSEEAARAIHTLLVDYPDIPVVLDPVFLAGGGKVLAEDNVVQAISALLVPLSSVVTPNCREVRMLAPEGDTLEACAMAVLEQGAHYVLLTDGQENSREVQNILFGNHRNLSSHAWPRLPEQYHGSGCTLAAAIAALIGHGHEVVSAVYQAQEFTWKSLHAAHQLGMGQKIPNRFHWAR